MCDERIREVVAESLGSNVVVVLLGTGSREIALRKAAENDVFAAGIRFAVDESSKTSLALGCHRGAGRTLTLRRWKNWTGLLTFPLKVVRNGWWIARPGKANNVGDHWLQGCIVLLHLGPNGDVATATVPLALSETSPGYPRINWSEFRAATSKL